MENQLEVEYKCILPVEVELESLQAHPDQVVEVKPKAKPRARSKPAAPVEGEEAKPKPKSRAKKTIIEVIPIVEEKQEQVVEVVAIPDDAVVIKKPKGHRLKNPDTVDMKTKTTCGDCNKTISVHNLKYTHNKHCKTKQAPIPQPVMFNESNHANHFVDDQVSKEDMNNTYLVDLRKKKLKPNKISIRHL